MNKIRTFIAIELPASIRPFLGNTQSELAVNLPAKSVRWVSPDNIHLTLKFLGDTDEEYLPVISSTMDTLAQDHSAFRLDIGQLGCFPNPRNPRIMWLGIQGETDQLTAIQKSIENSLSSLGWEPERRQFHPHLTLGRIKDSRAVATARLPWGQTFETLGFAVDSIVLFESLLQPAGAKYIVHHTSNFKNRL